MAGACVLATAGSAMAQGTMAQAGSTTTTTTAQPAAALPAQQPPVIELAEPAATAATVQVETSAIGRPTGLAPGAPAAFWIWIDAQDNWHLRTTTAGQLHVFRGRIVGVGGPLASVTPSRVEFRDRMRLTARGGVAFAFATQGHIDGFDFRPADGRCVRFNLQLDNGPGAGRVLVGSNAQAAPGAQFQICKGAVVPAGGTAAGTATTTPPSGPAVAVPTQPAFAEPPEAHGRPTAVAWDASALGRPGGLHAGAPAGYWIWSDAAGQWHLRTTTATQLHVFRGRVTSTRGAISDVSASRTEFNDRVRLNPRGVAFVFATQGGIDGFDFRAPADSCLQFHLQMDNGGPGRVAFGARETIVNAPHFEVCTGAPAAAVVQGGPPPGGPRGRGLGLGRRNR